MHISKPNTPWFYASLAETRKKFVTCLVNYYFWNIFFCI
jgi:hypothetical protein